MNVDLNTPRSTAGFTIVDCIHKKLDHQVYYMSRLYNHNKFEVQYHKARHYGTTTKSNLLWREIEMPLQNIYSGGQKDQR